MWAPRAKLYLRGRNRPFLAFREVPGFPAGFRGVPRLLAVPFAPLPGPLDTAFRYQSSILGRFPILPHLLARNMSVVPNGLPFSQNQVLWRGGGEESKKREDQNAGIARKKRWI